MKPVEFKKILIPLDFSPTSMVAFEHAVKMAKTFKAELFMLHVMEDTLLINDIFLPETKMVNLGKISKIAENKMMELASDVSSQIKTHAIVRQGKAAGEIIITAKEIGIDLIVMGTHGSSGFEEFFIGSNAERVVVGASCPVLTIQSYAKTPGFKNIVFPVDNSISSRQKLAHATVLAKHFDSKIFVLGLLSEDQDKDHVKTFELKIQQVNEFLEKNQVMHESTIVHREDHANIIMKFASEKDADLILIMTEQEFDSSNYFLGSSAQTIVNHSKVPVLVVRPEGFEVSWTKNNPM
ncbi:MAG: universal stress protein [Bacteroidetes bacterium]|nr:universal stress protein [Bacteroidota bacterium]HET6244952.1 universal stress protein [Bacteroidia bacterium]